MTPASGWVIPLVSPSNPVQIDTGEDMERPLAVGKLPPELLQRLIEQYRTPPDPDLLVEPAIGHDAAAVAFGDDVLVVKSDPITFVTDSAARYLVAINANDVACLGGRPRWLTVVALLPTGQTSSASVESLFADLRDTCLPLGISLIGGHTEVTLGLDRPILVGTLLGTATRERLVKPGGARVGDALLMTKAIGIEGTALLAREKAEELRPLLGDERLREAAKLLHRPGISIVRDAEAVLRAPGVHALHDPTEGGVAMGVREIAAAAGVGAELLADSLPMLPETRTICDHFGLDPLGLLGSGSLLVAADRYHVAAILAAAREDGIPIARIGQILPRDEGFVLIESGGTRALPRFEADEVTRVL